MAITAAIPKSLQRRPASTSGATWLGDELFRLFELSADRGTIVAMTTEPLRP